VSRVVLFVLKCLQLLGLVRLSAPEPVKPKPPPPPRKPLLETHWDNISNKDLLVESIKYQAKTRGLICDHCRELVQSNFKIGLEGNGWYWKCPTCSHPNRIGLK